MKWILLDQVFTFIAENSIGKMMTAIGLAS